MTIPTKQHPSTGHVLYAERRRNGTLNDSAYVWSTPDRMLVLDPTPEEDNEIHQYYDGDHAITE